MKTGIRGSVLILGLGAKFGVDNEWAEDKDLTEFGVEVVDRFFLLVDFFRVPDVEEVLLLALLLQLP